MAQAITDFLVAPPLSFLNAPQPRKQPFYAATFTVKLKMH